MRNLPFSVPFEVIITTREMVDIQFIESQLAERLKTVFDPEIPVNIYDLGLIYDVDVNLKGEVDISMTLTAPNCPMADALVADVKQAVMGIEGVSEVHVEIVFDPPWDESRMSDAARLELGWMEVALRGR